jgi:Domain of unknown function (DUF5122) beta-propeller
LTATTADRHISQPASQGGRTSDHQLSSATQDGKTDEASSEILAVIAREGVISSFRLFLRVLPAVALLVARVVLSPPASAAPGNLDPTLGSGGKVTTAFIGGSASASSLVVQPDGKIVAAAGLTGLNDFAARNFALARYNTDGSIDTGFGPARRK